jgi:hypothetical protein
MAFLNSEQRWQSVSTRGVITIERARVLKLLAGFALLGFHRRASSPRSP